MPLVAIDHSIDTENTCFTSDKVSRVLKKFYYPRTRTRTFPGKRLRQIRNSVVADVYHPDRNILSRITRNENKE